jgi:phage-related tail fiber protein
MKHLKTPAASLALLLSALVATPAMSASSTASSASDSASSAASSGSDSLKKSSDSSSKTTTAAAGDYEVVAVTAVAEQPGTLRMTLQAVADRSAEGEYFLYVPEQTVEHSRVAAGQVVTARARPYGLEFARSDSGHAFFLVLNDDWARDVPSHAVTL